MIKALQLILSLVLLVTIHEFGHYIFARIFGVRVNRFYLFFNPWFSLLKYKPAEGRLEIIAWTSKPKDNPEGPELAHSLLDIKVKKHAAEKNGKPTWAATLYGIGWVPLGGYCDIAGMVDETKGADQLESEPQPWEFRTKPAWKRFMVMVAGVVFNFILAIIIYIGIAWHWGEAGIPYENAVYGMDYSEAMREAGFVDGDRLLTVNGKPVDTFKNGTLLDIIGDGNTITVLRGADTAYVTIPKGTTEKCVAENKAPFTYRFPQVVKDVPGGQPAARAGMMAGDTICKIGADTITSFDRMVAALTKHKGQPVDITVRRGGKELTMPVDVTDSGDKGTIGVYTLVAKDLLEAEYVKYGFFEAVPRGITNGVSTLKSYVSSLKLLFTKTGAQQVGGFGTLGSLFASEWNWEIFWSMTAFLSVILAFMNIIPIPGLDGGHVLFLLWEMITGRKASDKVLEVANTIGFVFLLLLLVYANGADIFRAFFK